MLALTGCQDVIDVELPESEPLLVIDGLVTDGRGSFVEISTSAAYFAQGETPKINRAKVLLFEDGAMVSELVGVDSVAGRFASSFQGEIGRSYFIEIEIEADEPNFYESTWRTTPILLKRVFQIDSVNTRLLNKRTNPQAFEEGTYALVYFQEPKGEGDSYRVRRALNDSLFSRDIFLVDDLGVDGLYFGKGLIGGFAFYGPLEPGDSIAVNIYSLAREHYDYLTLLAQQVFQVGSTFDPPPAPLYGNLYNVADPSILGFGYFGASAVESSGIRYPQ